MSDFIREVDEEYRQDQFRNFLSRYWVALLLLVVVVLAGAGGWRGYQYYRQQQAEAAGARYFDALDRSAADPKATTAALDALAKDGPEGYRVLARFRSASDLGRSDASAGAKAFDAIATDPAIAQEFRDIAGLRAGILTVDAGDASELQRRLGPLADTNSPYRSLAREMLAVAALKRGDDCRCYQVARRHQGRCPGFAGQPSAGRLLPHPGPGPATRAACFGSARGSAMSKVAIIGRPNVGKSTLFNRLVGKKLALVDDQPGVTRDRREGEASLFDADFTLIDTAGLDNAADETLAGRMRQQTEVAVADADVILFVIDSRVGVTPMDSHFAGLVRRADKPIIVVANKAEGRAGEAGALEAHALGLGTPVAISAEHNEGMIDLYEALAAVLPESAPELPEEDYTPLILGEDEDGTELDLTKPLRIAVVGRPNAGKSTLLNAWLGEDRLLTGPEPGITRDAIGIEFKWRERDLKIFDTAGLRKRARIEDKVEKLAAADAIRAVQFAEVVIVLLDATIPFEKQDLTIAALAEREGRAIVIGVNKWDLIEARGSKLSEMRESAERLLPQIKGVAVVPVSGRTGFGLDKLLEASLKVAETWNRRVSTARINRWLSTALDANPPPAVSGRRIKIRYMTQPKARPPTFVLFGNQLNGLPRSYQRYLVNQMREVLDLPGVPIRIVTRQGDNPYDKNKNR